MKVPFPYTNRPVQQRRPALVVAVPGTPSAPHLLWVLMVTSAVNRGWPGDCLISDHRGAGLPVASVVRPAKIATIDAHEAEAIGRLPIDDQVQIDATLRTQLAQALSL